MPRYRLGRRATTIAAVQVQPQAEVVEPTYRDLQAQAKDLGVPANQSADELKEAIAEKSDGE